VSAAFAACAVHLDREALGVCVRCRKRVCSECSTKVDGVNHCVTCLSNLARDGVVASAAVGEPHHANGLVSTWRAAVKRHRWVPIAGMLWACVWWLLVANLPGGG
jgi:hypothetical protein